MPRHPRVHAEGLLYHVMARGNDGQKIFLRQSGYQAFIEALRTVRQCWKSIGSRRRAFCNRCSPVTCGALTRSTVGEEQMVEQMVSGANEEQMGGGFAYLIMGIAW